jgi:hypothetical protein
MTRTITVSGYVILAAAMVTYQTLGLVRRETATLGQAVATLIRSRAGRSFILTVWLWLGWHAFVRSSH